MGINSSTRRVTVVNDNQTGVIRISESVVHKLSQSQQQKQPISLESHLTAEDVAVKPQQTISQPQQLGHQIKEVPANEVVYGIPVSTSIREEHEREIQRLETSWRSQMDELQKQNRQLWRTANEKLSANITETEKQVIKSKCEPICRQNEKQVVECYSKNKSQPLKCSQEVKNFVQCVHEVRREVLGKDRAQEVSH